VAAVGRYGGEEFLVVLESDRAGHLAALERMCRAVNATPIDAGRALVPVTLSVGAARFLPGADPSRLISTADDELYRAKADGRNCLRMARTAASPSTRDDDPVVTGGSPLRPDA
jgi:diguanylate cyclase